MKIDWEDVRSLMEFDGRVADNYLMKASIIDTWDSFLALEPEWNDLLVRSRATSIFLTWEWIDCWRKILPNPVEPLVITVRDGEGTLCGIAPYYMSSLRFMKTLRYTSLRVLGDSVSGAEYADWIVDPSSESEICNAIAEGLRECVDTWDLVWMPRMASWTGAQSRAGDSMCAAGFKVHVRESDFSAIVLPSSMEEFENSFSSKRRQRMRSDKRRFDAMDGVEYVTCRSRHELPEFLEALFDLHERRWLSIGQSGVFVRQPQFARQFYLEFAPIALANGWLAIHAMKDKASWQAIQYGYVFANEYAQLQEGFNPDFERGAGNVLRHHMIGELIDDGIASYDFLGGWSEHKRRWGAIKRTGVDIFAGSGRMNTWPLFAREVWPSGRFIDEL